MVKFLSDPRVYVAWLVVLAGALFAAYAIDPYVFGMAVFGLGAATGLLCVSGGLFVVLNRGASRRAKRTVGVSLLLAVALVVGALAVLGTFRWA